MYLSKPIRFEQILLAIQAVERRSQTRAQPAEVWQLNAKTMLLLTPKKVAVRLSDSDVVLMRCFLEAQGQTVTQATDEAVPLQSKPRVGYVFRGKLVAA